MWLVLIISNVIDDIPVYELTLRVRDYVTGQTIGGRCVMPGGGSDSRDFHIYFSSVHEFDTFMDVLKSMRDLVDKSRKEK